MSLDLWLSNRLRNHWILILIQNGIFHYIWLKECYYHQPTSRNHLGLSEWCCVGIVWRNWPTEPRLEVYDPGNRKTRTLKLGLIEVFISPIFSLSRVLGVSKIHSKLYIQHHIFILRSFWLLIPYYCSRNQEYIR